MVSLVETVDGGLFYYSYSRDGAVEASEDLAVAADMKLLAQRKQMFVPQ
jgi:hypothetical protein